MKRYIMATVGKNILGNLTTGMYGKSVVIYREYIQNSCDQIDKAIEEGIVSKEDAIIEIDIRTDERKIYIKDNATGISIKEFKSSLGDIANSDKKIGKNKGFRGIGRLCGLAYCKELRFETSYVGESKKSIMVCNALKMREMLEEEKKYTLEEVWNTIVRYEEEPENKEEHYFEVILNDINKENSDLLNTKEVKEYLSFVAPVPYDNNFLRCNEIYEYAKKNNHRIDEYKVKVNGKVILKSYNTSIYDGSNRKVDQILRLDFKEFITDDGEKLGWGWIGIPSCKGVIPPINKMYGIRLRSSNIQIGNELVFVDLFKEDRGTKYFVGEIFATHSKLVPNSQRDYFNENETRLKFEIKLREYFNILHQIYNKASKLSSAFRDQTHYNNLTEEFNKKIKENGFVNSDQKNLALNEIEKAKAKYDKAKRLIENNKNLPTSNPLSDIFDVLNRNNKDNQTPLTIDNKEKSDYVTKTMSSLNRKERRIVERVLDIVIRNAPREIAEIITAKVKEEFK